MPFTEQEKRIATELLKQAVDTIGTELFEELEVDLDPVDAKRIRSALARVGEAGWRQGEATMGAYIEQRTTGGTSDAG